MVDEMMLNVFMYLEEGCKRDVKPAGRNVL